MITLGKYMKAELVSFLSGKTFVVDILSTSSGARLGRIKWYGPWRQYVFYPAGDDVLFNVGCLTVLGAYLNHLNKRKKIGWL
jgi:hypothetical protein